MAWKFKSTTCYNMKKCFLELWTIKDDDKLLGFDKFGNLTSWLIIVDSIAPNGLNRHQFWEINKFRAEAENAFDCSTNHATPE